jgi:hypothetical protein
MSRVEVVGSVVYRQLIKLTIVCIYLTLSSFKVNCEVVFRRLRVSVKVNLTILLIVTFKLTKKVLKDRDNLIYYAILT